MTYRAQGYSSVAYRAPTADSSQSKMWHTDGSQWALMATDGAGSAVHVFELTADYSWRDTGTVVDSRRASADALWLPASQSLVVALSERSSPVRIVRFSYDSATRTWNRDPAYPMALRTGDGTGSTVIDEDSTGRLWITYTRESTVWVALGSIRQVLVRTVPAAGPRCRGQLGRCLVPYRIRRKAASTERGVYVYAAVETSRKSTGPHGGVRFAPGVLVRRPASAGAGRWSQEAAGAWGDHRQPILMVQVEMVLDLPVGGGGGLDAPGRQGIVNAMDGEPEGA